MVPGVRVHAAFAFCDVRRFTDLTECLEEEVFGLINCVAAIVHGAAVASGGAPNKNVGDAFLCVWRAPDDDLPSPPHHHSPPRLQIEDAAPADGAVAPASPTFTLTEAGAPAPPAAAAASSADADAAAVASEHAPPATFAPVPPPPPGTAAAGRARVSPADRALACAVAVLREVASSPALLAYAKHPRVAARLGANYKVRLGFGLHTGWAVEGAIGSRHKVWILFASHNRSLSF